MWEALQTLRKTQISAEQRQVNQEEMLLVPETKAELALAESAKKQVLVTCCSPSSNTRGRTKLPLSWSRCRDSAQVKYRS